MIIENRRYETIRIGTLKADEKHKGVGLITHNCIGCDFYIDEISNFNIGLLASSDSSPGHVHNRYFIKGLVNNKHNFDMLQSLSGWVNQNMVIGGHFAHYSDNPHDSDEFSQIRLLQASGSRYGPPDNNMFLNVSIEGPAARYFIECTGSHNIFDNLRYERGYGVKPHRVKFHGKNNTLRGGFDSDKLAVHGDFPIFESMTMKSRLKIYAQSLIK